MVSSSLPERCDPHASAGRAEPKHRSCSACFGNRKVPPSKRSMKATQWQAHSVRGFLSRKVAGSLGLPLQSTKRDGQRVYALPPDTTLAGQLIAWYRWFHVSSSGPSPSMPGIA